VGDRVSCIGVQRDYRPELGCKNVTQNGGSLFQRPLYSIVSNLI
jgi:hypothetical protein